MQAESKAKKKTSFLSRFAEVWHLCCYQIKLSRLPLMGGNRDREGQLLRNRELSSLFYDMPHVVFGSGEGTVGFELEGGHGCGKVACLGRIGTT